MTVAEITLAVFTLLNSLRFFAYVPQIAKAAKDQSGAEAISFGTWALFLASHASGMAYAIENQGDWKMASVFLGNAVGCSAVLLIAGWKRGRHRKHKADARTPHETPGAQRDERQEGPLSCKPDIPRGHWPYDMERKLRKMSMPQSFH